MTKEDEMKLEARRDDQWSEWRRFWDYWYEKPDLTMREAFTLYLMNLKEEPKVGEEIKN
jgi:hypothetical protein